MHAGRQGRSASADLRRASRRAGPWSAAKSAGHRLADARPSRRQPRSRGPPRPSARRQSARAMSPAPFSASRSFWRSGRCSQNQATASSRASMAAGSSSGPREPRRQQARAGRGHRAVDGGQQRAFAAARGWPASISRLARVAGSMAMTSASPARRGARQRRQPAGLGGLQMGGDQAERGDLRAGQRAEAVEGLDAVEPLQPRLGRRRLGQGLGHRLRRSRRPPSAPRRWPRRRTAGRGPGSRKGRSAASAEARPRDARSPGIPPRRWKARRWPPPPGPPRTATAARRLAPRASSRPSSVRVPGVTTRTTSRRTTDLDPRFLRLGRVLHLLADRDLEAGADQLGEIGLRRVHRHAAHRDRHCRRACPARSG